MAQITDLPVEILLRIFQFYLEDKSQFELINILANVCKSWNAMCFDSTLWKKFDGTVHYEIMRKLLANGSLSHTRELIVSNVKCLKDKHAEELFSNLEKLEAVNLTQVREFSKNLISILGKSSLKLKEIQIGRKSSSEKPLVLRISELGPFFSSKGRNLTTIKLSYCNIQNPSLTLKYLSQNCPNLEHLNFTNNKSVGVFPINHFQANCSKLKVLHLDHNICIGARRHPAGFPNLEVFSYNDLSLISHIADKDIESILSNSPNLKFLSLTNCSISADVLFSLPANSVEYLFLSRSKTINSDNLLSVFEKWCCTLKQVDVSYSNNVVVNRALLSLAMIPDEPPIEFLDLSFTQVTSDTVRIILEKCHKLEMLHLNACRSLNRGFKRKYSDREEVKSLFKKLEMCLYDASTDEEMSA